MSTATSLLRCLGTKLNQIKGPKLRRSKCSMILGQHVRQALANDEPVVALESTVITHGLPEPENFELAMSVEQQVRAATNNCWSTDTRNASQKATPATIALVNGQIVVGLSESEIEYLSNKQTSKAIKASRRDIPIALARGHSAGTTVAATMAIATSAPRWTAESSSKTGGPIKVFATGGLGGVHMGGQNSMDISADLYEFARSPIAVVSAGFKSFLDTRLSLEFLETMGATVMSFDYKEGSESSGDHLFPGFFTKINAQLAKSPCSVQSLHEAAQILTNCFDNLPLIEQRGALLAVPIRSCFNPSASHLPDKELGEAIERISREIDRRTDLNGKEKTPLILDQLHRETKGKTLAANIGLLKTNAQIGALLAINYANLINRTGVILEPNFTKYQTPVNEKLKDGILVFGCTMIDMHVATKMDDNFKSNKRFSGVTFEGDPHLTLGGVGRNLATAINMLGHKTTFITSLARDNLAQFALAEFRRSGFQESQLLVNWLEEEPSPSSCFALVLVDSHSGQCDYVIANLQASRAIDTATVELNEHLIEQSKLVVMDANLMDCTMQRVIQLCHKHETATFIEPTDVLALPRLVDCFKRLDMSAYKTSPLLVLSPNLVELLRMIDLFEGKDTSDDNSRDEFTIEEIEKLAKNLIHLHMPQLDCLLVTLDKRGVLVAVQSPGDKELDEIRLMSREATGSDRTIKTKHYKAPEIIERPVSGSGAGDSFAAGFISALATDSKLSGCISNGFRAANLALQDRDTISSRLRDLAI